MRKSQIHFDGKLLNDSLEFDFGVTELPGAYKRIELLVPSFSHGPDSRDLMIAYDDIKENGSIFIGTFNQRKEEHDNRRSNSAGVKNNQLRVTGKPNRLRR
jgi:hypothetical protein